MYANVLKFHIWIPHENIGDPYFFFSSKLSPILELFPYENNSEILYICIVITVMGEQCWSQPVLSQAMLGA